MDHILVYLKATGLLVDLPHCYFTWGNLINRSPKSIYFWRLRKDVSAIISLSDFLLSIYSYSTKNSNMETCLQLFIAFMFSAVFLFRSGVTTNAWIYYWGRCILKMLLLFISQLCWLISLHKQCVCVLTVPMIISGQDRARHQSKWAHPDQAVIN